MHARYGSDSKSRREPPHELWCSVLFIHHAHKSGQGTSGRREGQRLRGSSALHGAVDAGIYLSGTETDMQSYWTNKVAVEIKEGAGAGRFKLTLNLKNDAEGRAYDGAWEVEKDAANGNQGAEKGIDEKVIAVLTAHPKGVDAVAKEVHSRALDVRAALQRLVETGKAVRIGGKYDPKGGFVRAGDAAGPPTGLTEEVAGSKI